MSLTTGDDSLVLFIYATVHCIVCYSLRFFVTSYCEISPIVYTRFVYLYFGTLQRCICTHTHTLYIQCINPSLDVIFAIFRIRDFRIELFHWRPLPLSLPTLEVEENNENTWIDGEGSQTGLIALSDVCQTPSALIVCYVAANIKNTVDAVFEQSRNAGLDKFDKFLFSSLFSLIFFSVT